MVRMATEMPTPIRAYSIAVVPDSSSDEARNKRRQWRAPLIWLSKPRLRISSMQQKGSFKVNTARLGWGTQLRTLGFRLHQAACPW